MNFGPVILVGGLSVIGGVGYIFLEDTLSGPASPAPLEVAATDSELVLDNVTNTAAPTSTAETIELKPLGGAKALPKMPMGNTESTGETTDTFSTTPKADEITMPNETQDPQAEAPASKHKTVKAENPEANCTLDMTATPANDGMVDVALTAPCFVGMGGVVSHNSYAFDFKLDDAGQAKMTIPAMSGYVIISASLENSQGDLKQFAFKDAERYDRVALSWTGEAEFTFGETGVLSTGTIWTSQKALGQFAAPVTEMTKQVVVFSRPAGAGDSLNSLSQNVAIHAPLSGKNCNAVIKTEMTGKLAGMTDIPQKTIEFHMPACEGEPGMAAMLLPTGEDADKLALSN